MCCWEDFDVCPGLDRAGVWLMGCFPSSHTAAAVFPVFRRRDTPGNSSANSRPALKWCTDNNREHLRSDRPPPWSKTSVCFLYFLHIIVHSRSPEPEPTVCDLWAHLLIFLHQAPEQSGASCWNGGWAGPGQRGTGHQLSCNSVIHSGARGCTSRKLARAQKDRPTDRAGICCVLAPVVTYKPGDSCGIKSAS